MNGQWTGHFFSPFYVLLPKRWRASARYGSETHLALAALISGLGEATLALIVLAFWYMLFLGMFNGVYVAGVLGHYKLSGTPTETVGVAGFIYLAINPITWVIAYFGLEGIFRATAAFTTGETVGTLPLYAMEFLWRVARPKRKVPELPLVPDEITPGNAGCDLQIASCRQREGWKYPYTLRYGGAYFQVIDEQYITVGPRPHIYRLRRLPPGEIARGLHAYDPTDVLTPMHKIQPL